MNVVALAMAASLGAGFMAVLHELVKWDTNRRLAGRLGAAAAADPLIRRPPVVVPHGRHHRGGLAALPVWDGAGQKIGAAA